MNLEATKAELAAEIVKALAIAFGQFPFGTLFQPADGDHDEAHELCFRNALAACALRRAHATYMRSSRFASA